MKTWMATSGAGIAKVRNGGPIARCAAILCAGALLALVAGAQDMPRLPSPWDMQLPAMELHDISIAGDNVQEAWKAMASDPLLRSVLIVDENRLSEVMYPFEFEAESCAAADLFDAFAANYNYIWTQDTLTGVIWFHPASTEFGDILPDVVTYPETELGLPMQRGVMEPLDTQMGSSLRVHQGGTLFLNTFDYPVNVPAGTYTARDVVNLCCIANPSKTFAAWFNTKRGYTRIQPINLNSDVPEPPAGLLKFWELEIGPLEDGPPTVEMVRMRFWDADARVRWAARMYYNVMLSRSTSALADLLQSQRLSAEQRAWVALGLLSVWVRTEEATYTESLFALRAAATDEFLLEGPAGVALLTAMELARVDGDTRALEILSQRKLKPSELEGIEYDACRIARGSETAWRALRGGENDGIYVDTGGWAASYLDETPAITPPPPYLQFRATPAK